MNERKSERKRALEANGSGKHGVILRYKQPLSTELRWCLYLAGKMHGFAELKVGWRPSEWVMDRLARAVVTIHLFIIFNCLLSGVAGLRFFTKSARPREDAKPTRRHSTHPIRSGFDERNKKPVAGKHQRRATKPLKRRCRRLSHSMIRGYSESKTFRQLLLADSAGASAAVDRATALGASS